MEHPGEFYWDIKTAALELIRVERGFKSLEDAKSSLQKFREDVANGPVIENLAL
jgi:hypothetical protein